MDNELKNTKMRIINKAKDGITIKAAHGTPQKMSWEEFNQNFIMEDDKKHCRFTEEFLKIGEEVQKCTVDAAASYLMANAMADGSHDKIVHMLVMQKNIDRITELIHCSMLDATMMVKKLVNSLQSGDAFRHKETPQEYRERKKQEAADRVRRQEEMNPHRTYTPTATSTLADAPGMDKLKAMFADEK